MAKWKGVNKGGKQVRTAEEHIGLLPPKDRPELPGPQTAQEVLERTLGVQNRGQDTTGIVEPLDNPWKKGVDKLCIIGTAVGRPLGDADPACGVPLGRVC